MLRGEEESVRLETLLGDRDGHLALLRLHEIGEREHGAVGRAAQKADDHEETDQTRHRLNSSVRDLPNWPVGLQIQAETTNQHVRAKLARVASSRYMLAANKGEFPPEPWTTCPQKPPRSRFRTPPLWLRSGGVRLCSSA